MVVQPKYLNCFLAKLQALEDQIESAKGAARCLRSRAALSSKFKAINIMYPWLTHAGKKKKASKGDGATEASTPTATPAETPAEQSDEDAS